MATLAGCPSPVAPPVDPLTELPIEDSGTPTGLDRAGLLVSELGNSVWHGTAERAGVVRTVEQHFRAEDREWAEVVNPAGPAWSRQLRTMDIATDGVTVTTEVIVPSGWEDDPEDGQQDTWTFEIVPGEPRVLRVTRDGVVEAYTEGAAPVPTAGFTATARVWNPGDAVDTAFCDSGIWGFDYPVLFDFARGEGLWPRAEDTVVGVPLGAWVDPGDNAFAVADVPGFRSSGGTDLADRFNFIVTYRGTFQHPGGDLRIREADDSVSDGVWVFLGPDAGVGTEDDYFLEVHGFYWWDGTTSEPVVSPPAGPVEIEVMIARCTEPMEPVELEVSLDGAPWMPMSQLPAVPRVSAFPAPF